MGRLTSAVGSRYSRATFGVLLGVPHLGFALFTDLVVGVLNGFQPLGIFTVTPLVVVGDWLGLWSFPSWAGWVYGACFVAIGLAGYWRFTYRSKLLVSLFLALNLVTYWLLYLWSEWGSLGEFLGIDVGYTLLMATGLVLFNTGTPSPMSSLSGVSGVVGTSGWSADSDTDGDTRSPTGTAHPAGGVSDATDGASDVAGEVPDPASETPGSTVEASESTSGTPTTTASATDDEPDEEASDTGEDTAVEDAGGEPSSIPRAPNRSIEYDALTGMEPIGGGGNADVRKATLPTPDGDVVLAIKEPRLSGTLHTEQVERLLNEAETWDSVDDHDHIVGVVDYGAEPLPWIAMEYMDGGELGDRAGKMAVPQALWTALAVTKGVRHAHRRGVAHLDLKPANVLFRSVDGAWDVPKVADWGLSKHLLTHSESVEGISPQYAAPEQFDDEYGPVDDITDVYQLGAVFYELFTGWPPFEGTPTKVMRAVLDDEPIPPSERADLPEGLDEVLLTALAKERADRYDDIVYLRDDLRDLYEE